MGTIRRGRHRQPAIRRPGLTRSLGDRRFLASVITGAIGVYALLSVIKNNQARPVRRAVDWYKVQGQIHDMKVLHDARRAVKLGKP
ncbi:MAG TPA: hypothetical protein VLW50_17590 [Streptosporangiaceae bacterium]|nr:hypothetical protein [Streptosporangiaceae bacterium]